MRKRKEAKELLLKEKQKYLDDIQALIGSVREAAEPLKNHLQLPPRDAAHQQQYQAVANLLPLPLYIVYRQLKAVAEIYADPVEVSVTGKGDVYKRVISQVQSSLLMIGSEQTSKKKPVAGEVCGSELSSCSAVKMVMSVTW